ncbi:major capsid protein [Dichelobacter nodosus]|uniref:Major capsid protein n=1 Tax=Dichelobacter nodosus (strain VCS1703A) TaxID=246195 RepID=A5EV05_DICNV|nr:major capsid protein [Dichelobacter nodosus]ABQ13809.1 conserved hypothetical protein [Dichelobacter nodosus VCS1703A]KNZ40132.1 hypothetical protein AKG33_00215 [Dichelobacter nodosus]
MADVLSKLGLTQAELDEAVNSKPNVPYRLLNSGLFQDKNLTTTSVMVEFTDKELKLIPANSRVGAANVRAYGKGSTVRTFTPPLLNLETTIRSEQIQDVRKVGTRDALLSNAEAMQEEIATHREMHDLTIEHLMLGAIKGKIIDADGETVLFDLFKELGISEPLTTIDAAAADIGQQFAKTLRIMKDGLAGDTCTQARVLCSRGFFDSVIAHKSAHEAFERYQENAFARNLPVDTFQWNGFIFEVYHYEIDGKPVIADGEAHAYLEGMQRGFTRYNATGTLMSAVNQIARPFYIDIEDLAHKRGISVYTESAPLPLCLRPKTLMHFKI